MEDYEPSIEVIEMSQSHETRLRQIELALSQILYRDLAKSAKLKVDAAEIQADLTESARDIAFTMKNYPEPADVRTVPLTVVEAE